MHVTLKSKKLILCSLLKEFCENNDFDLISHDNINVKRHVNKRKLHLNDTGRDI